MTSPTFLLPACPLCSTILTIEHPFWRFASNTSAQRKQKCYIFCGCVHAVGDNPADQIQETPEEWALTEELWAAEAAALFEARTEGWTASAVDRFRRELTSAHALPGATDPLPLTEDTSSEPKNQI